MTEKKSCCPMRLKIVVGIAAVLTEQQCGVPDSAMLDYHDFDFQSQGGVPVGAALKFAFCPWCGTRLTAAHESRTTEVIRGVADEDRGDAWKTEPPESE